MSIHRTTYVLFLLLLWAMGGAPLHPIANAQETISSAQETTVAALEANAAHYPPGLLVTELTKDSTAEQAGVKVGDLILSLDGVALRFDSQIILVRDKARWNHKKIVTLTVQRDTQRLQFSLTVAPLLGLHTRPPLPDSAQKLNAEVDKLPPDQKADRVAKTKTAAEAAEQMGDLRAAAWLWNEVYLSAPDGSREENEALNRTLFQATKAGDALLTAVGLNSLGVGANSRGNLAEAENYHQRALTIREKLAPNSLDVAASLNNVGLVAYHRGKFDEAENFYRRALVIEEKLASNSPDVATCLNNLGLVAYHRGKLDEAENYCQRALTIQEKLTPNSLDIAESLNNLGDVAYLRGKLDEAPNFYQRALEIEEKLAPNSLDMARSLNNLGLVDYHRGKLDEAENFYQRALAIDEKMAPNSLNVANSLNNIGNVARERGKLEEAETFYTNAWRIVQVQGRQVAGDNGRQAFGEKFGYMTTDLLIVHLQRNHPEAAFATLEEGRSQALVQVMAERGLTEKVTPPAVWQDYQRAVSAYDIAFKQAEQSAAPVEKARVLLVALKEQKADTATLQEKEHTLAEAEQAFAARHDAEVNARAEMESHWSEVRRSAKAAIPEPIDANAARTRLPVGTLVLEFSVSEKQVVLFAATVQGVNAYTLAAPREELEAKVKFVRRLVAQDTEERAALANDADVRNDALRTLYGKLFPHEVQTAIQQAKRVVLSADDFLWDLPFGALVTNTSGTPTYLAQQKPLSYTQSLTLYLQPSLIGGSGNTRSPAGSVGVAGSDVLAIGNPLYDNLRRADMIAAAQQKAKPTGSASAKLPAKTPPVQVASARRDEELGTITADGMAPPQLEYAQKEAEQIAALYHTSAHIGVEPTEAWFRQQVANARIIHLATHGFLNPFAAQSSGVLLAVPAVKPPVGQYDNDGALQAWEVWSLKLNADLVVLSACETGRGVKVTGEGLIGLTRAWQYAGAKTIVSSLWKVSDASTATLMTAFHKHLLAGAEKDEALRLAMVETAASKQGAWSQPHYWAAFVLVGDTGRLR